MISVWELLRVSCLTYKHHFNLLAGYAAWLLLPYAGLVLFSLSKPNVFFDTLTILAIITQAILALWLGILIPKIIMEIAVGSKKIPLLDLQTQAWRLMSSVIFVAILESIIFLGGLILLIVPAFIFWVWFAMAQLVVIFENKKGLDALSFSRELVRGRFWPSAWRMLAGPFAVGLTASLGVGLIISLLALIFQVPFDQVFGDTPPLWAETISMIVETFSLPIILIYFTLLYLELTKNSSKIPSDASESRG